MIPHNLVFGLTPEKTVFEGFQDPLEVSWGDWWGQKYKNFKHFHGHIETIPLMPHNLVFGLTPEKTVFGGFQDPLEGSWGDW